MLSPSPIRHATRNTQPFACLGLLLLAALVSCRQESTQENSAEAPTEENLQWKELLGTRWRLVEIIRDDEGAGSTAVEGEGYWIEFTHDLSHAGGMLEHVYSGEAGSKNFGGQFVTGGEKALILGDVHLTGMTGAEETDLDKEFLEMVDRTTSFEMAGDELTLIAPGLKKSGRLVR